MATTEHGADGKDGINGNDGVKGNDGVDGKDGATGADGKDGVDGKDGATGADGKDGVDGKDGATGADGKDGVNGNDGTNGVNGKDGVDGKDGKDFIKATLPYDYYSSAFKNVDRGHLFQTLVYDDLYTLLTNNKVSGDFVVLFGGAWDDYTQGAISYINQIAKQNNIKKVYVFDTKIDGNLSESIVGRIGDNAVNPANKGRIGYTGFQGASANKIDFLYDNFDIKDFRIEHQTTTMLAAINAVCATNGNTLSSNNDTAVVTPTLVCFNRATNSTTASIKDIRVTSAFTYAKSLTGTVAQRYKSELATFFSQVTNEGEIFDAFMIRSYRNNSDNTSGRSGNTFMTKNTFLATVSYSELIALLESDGDHMILFGGIWCPNTDGILTSIQDAAKASKYTGKIYMFDPRLDGNTTSTFIRNDDVAETDSKLATYARLYSNLLDNYFPDFWSKWNSEDSLTRPLVDLGFSMDMTYTINGKVYSKMCSPNVMLYNKDVRGGIIDTFESELIYGRKNGEASGIYGAGTDKNSAASIFAMTSLNNMFAKFGLAEGFINNGYNVTVSFDGFNSSLSAVKKGSSIAMNFYYLKADADTAAAANTSWTLDGNILFKGDKAAVDVVTAIRNDLENSFVPDPTPDPEPYPDPVNPTPIPPTASC